MQPAWWHQWLGAGAGGCHCLGNKDGSMLNGSVAVLVAKIIKNVMASAAEAEVGALFMNAQLAAPMRVMCWWRSK